MSTIMNSRQRVLTALNHQEPDRVPIFLGASNTIGLQIEVYRAVKERLGIEAEDQYLYQWPELGTARLDESTLQALGSDVRGVRDRYPTEVVLRNAAREPGTPFVDNWGIGQVEVEPGVWFPGVHPLKDAVSIGELEDYDWPTGVESGRFDHVGERCARLTEEGEYAVMGAPWLLFPFERAVHMQGMETFLLNLAVRPEFAEHLLIKCAETCQRIMDGFLEAADGCLDIIKIGDDLGTSQSLLISPDMYREILKPIHADYIAFIKERTDARVFFHSDGDIFPLIPDLIEIGVEILNPVQTSAGKMADLERLKDKYGQDLVFCGAVDTTRVLPSGTPEDVRAEVRDVIRALAPGGGYLLSSVHTIQNEVPAENVLAMVDAAREFGSYPIPPVN
jgi:uroporphyrinogen decarboxylase